jgi:hypothetical protein
MMYLSSMVRCSWDVGAGKRKVVHNITQTNHSMLRLDGNLAIAAVLHPHRYLITNCGGFL